MSTQGSLTQYLDYRTFLVAHAQEQKRRSTHWTFGAWSKRLGLKGTASLTRVIQGNRHPGPQMIESLVRYFSFGDKDAEYFRDLVRLSALIMEKMGKKFANGVVKYVDEKTFNVISNWYHLPIREMVRLNDFRPDPLWIARNLMFKVGVREVGQALRTLTDLGLVALDDKGRMTLAQGRLNTGDDVANEAVKRHHEEMLENARAALRMVPVEKREITSQCIAISSEKLPQAKELIRQFQDKFSELMEDDVSCDVIYQMQIQFFPLSREVRGHEPSDSTEQSIEAMA
jgi:uncharacterized protein (TIGR02147 family)